MQEFINKTR